MSKRTTPKKSRKKKHVDKHPHTHAPTHHDPKPGTDLPVDHAQGGYIPAATHKVRKLDKDFAAACAKLPPQRRQFTGDQQRLDYIEFVKENS